MPLIYRCKSVSRDAQGIHLQCIGGVHYNALVVDNEEFWKENDTIERIPIEEREHILWSDETDLFLPQESREVVDEGDRVEENVDVSKEDESLYLDVLMASVVHESCIHTCPDQMRFKVKVGEKSYCGSWDTGAMICLVARCVVEELNREGLVIVSRQVKVKIVGIGEGIVKAGEEVR